MNTKRRTRGRRRPAAGGRHRRIRLQDVVIAEYPKLLAWPNVERVAVGWKERRGRVTSRVSVKIFVREKKADLSREEMLPRTTRILVPVGRGMYESRRVPTDVVWHAAPGFCAAPGDFLNPVLGGAWLARAGSQGGTCGCVVTDPAGHRFALTAGHVVRPAPGVIVDGIAIVQPPTTPTNLPPGESILLGETVSGFFGNRPDGFVDFALIEFRDGRTGLSTALDGVEGNGPILPWADVANSRIEVTKFGATTGRTNAVCAGPVPSIVIDGVTVTNVYEFLGVPGPPFGQNGDSGALVVSLSPESVGGIVGVLFATTPPLPDAPAGRGYVFPFERLAGLRPV